jgi:N,N'-diacetyllegionaminate synthase
MRKKINIGGINIGEGYPVFVIAEVAQAHDGSLGAAHAYIDAVAKTGANAIKFQTHIAEAESSKDEKFRINSFPQDNTRYDYWKRMEFTESQWIGLANHAKQKKLIFLSTPFSHKAAELLEKIEVPAWKIGSGEIKNLPLIEFVAKTKKPVLLSTGMASWEDIENATSLLSGLNCDISIFQCTSNYPCPPSKIGLNVIEELRSKYDCPIGLSDHSGTTFSSLAATALKVNLIEIHVVFSKECFGPDVQSSITTDQLKELVQGIRFIESAMSSVIDKNKESIELSDLSTIFGRSIYLVRPLKKGHILVSEDLIFKKPGTGIPIKKSVEILGKKLTRDYDIDEQLKETDLE